jgi:hypothetical protein
MTLVQGLVIFQHIKELAVYEIYHHMWNNNKL